MESCYIYIFNFLIIKHKRRKVNGNFQDILMYREEFPDKKAEVMLIRTELGLAKLFVFFSLLNLYSWLCGGTNRWDELYI